MQTTSSDPRAHPDRDFIEAIRARYPVESEVDRVLTRKMAIRDSGDYQRETIEQITDGLRRLIASEIDDDFTIEQPAWLGGGASKLQVSFVLEWSPDGGARRRTPMVLRMEPLASIVETSRLREFSAIRAAKDAVPVPECYWVDAEANHLPHPGLIYARAEGVTKPSRKVHTQVTGIGTNFGPELRKKLGAQFADHLAAIHTIPADRLKDLEGFDAARQGSNDSIIRQIGWWRRVWEEDRLEPLPLIEIAASWLKTHAPPLDHVSLVHGDFRAGNFLYSEESEQITAWLDWELAVIGDRHQDLAWLLGPHFGHYAEDGTTFLACGLLPPDELIARYEKASGLSVDPQRLHYFAIYNAFVSTVHMLGTAGRVAKQGGSHQDVLVGWLAMIGHGIAAALREMMEDVL